MKSPVCATSDLLMTERLSIEIDYCPQCREPLQAAMPPAPQAPRQAPQTHDSHGGYREKHDGEHQGYRRKKSIWQEFFD